ncbi:methylmalonyl-CoA mutase family protein [Nocardioides convexus]|uniref:methylmalonyl-CoA mutase family protein n=1 Tax=Nocardioides convexus TaxID=2712224 RepID=UPI002418344B|nr:methylmalonyl-CoA mutase family protein [Nocardioides convexus]
MLLEFDRISERGGVLGAMETGYQRGRIQDESMLYEHRKHDGSLPIIGVNTFRNPSAGDGTPDHIESGPRDHRGEGLPGSTGSATSRPATPPTRPRRSPGSRRRPRPGRTSSPCSWTRRGCARSGRSPRRSSRSVDSTAATSEIFSSVDVESPGGPFDVGSSSPTND